MLACHQPDPPPLRASNPDQCFTMTLLYRRYWLIVHWTDMQTAPRIERAYVQDSAWRYCVPVAIDRLTVLSHAAFTAWYSEHWQRFMTVGVVL